MHIESDMLRRLLAGAPLKLAFALAMALVLAFAGASAVVSPPLHESAQAAIYVAEDEEQTDEQEGEAAEGEQIDDEENPMSSGLEGGEPLPAAGSGLGIGITAAIIAGIIAVIAYFGISTGRLNSSIKKMNNTFR